MATVNADGFCQACDYRHESRGEPGAPLVDGTYSPSGFVVLSSGELECPPCEGGGHQDTEVIGDFRDCENCEGTGTVPCGHGQEESDE